MPLKIGQVCSKYTVFFLVSTFGMPLLPKSKTYSLYPPFMEMILLIMIEMDPPFLMTLKFIGKKCALKMYDLVILKCFFQWICSKVV